MVALLSNSADLHKQYVLITGTSTGIGWACAVHLAARGFGVIAGVRDDGDAEAVEAAGAGTPGGIRAVLIDVADAGSIARAAVSVREMVGEAGLYGLVNNAGICVVGPVECVSLHDWRRQFEVNFFGVLAVTQAMLPLVRAACCASRPGHGADRQYGIGYGGDRHAFVRGVQRQQIRAAGDGRRIAAGTASRGDLGQHDRAGDDSIRNLAKGKRGRGGHLGGSQGMRAR